jgi:ribosomal protein S18 acetylase RimI-like enzyme
MGIVIREAESGDVAVIVQLIQELATSTERSPITETYVMQYLDSPTSTILLAETQGNVVGLLSYSLRPDLYHAANSCLIEEIVVQESMRGRGVGSTLLTELLSRLSSKDCAEVSLAVMSDNTGAIRFYKRHGLREEALFLERHFS